MTQIDLQKAVANDSITFTTGVTGLAQMQTQLKIYTKNIAYKVYKTMLNKARKCKYSCAVRTVTSCCTGAHLIYMRQKPSQPETVLFNLWSIGASAPC